LTELRRPTPLDPTRHNRAGFDSGEPVLDEWLRRYAGQNRRRDTAATWVILDADDTVVAYASIAMTGIDRSAAPASVAKHTPDPIPALLLGRLAVDRRFQGLGYGRFLLADALWRAVRSEIAAFAVIVDAKDDAARRFYERESFLPFPDQPMKLFRPMADIRALFE
jgi:GNAT superfamily N-acetyltransferase